MKFKKVILTSLMTAPLFLTGCATQQVPVAQEPAKPNPFLIAMAESASEIKKSAQDMKMLDQAIKMPKLDENQARQMAQAQAYVPADFRVTVTVPPFDGTPEKLLQAIANGIGWNFKTYGNRPAVTEIIQKQYREAQVIDIVKDIGYSINSGDVIINEREKTIVLKYNK